MGEDLYDGPVIFGFDGVHYPADDEGHPDTTRPLRWVKGSSYRDAEPDEPLHNDVHGPAGNVVELDPGSE